MFRKALTFCGTLLVAATLVFLTPGSSQAVPSWDGHDGGDSASAGASSGGGSARALEVILKASGVPNQNGRVAWPLGLRLLGAGSLMQQLEAQLRLAVEQVTAGGANPLLLDEIRLNVEALRQGLRADKEERFSMPLATYEDAERFLQKLDRMPRILAASPPASPPAAPREGSALRSWCGWR